MNIVYLHGFGSSPKSAKAQAVQRLLGADCAHFTVPALDGDDFFRMTMATIADRACAAVETAAANGPVLVIGSSLGGYVAAWLAAAGRLPAAISLVLVAPAFRFTARWRERLGEDGLAAWRRDGQRLFWHYGCEREVPLAADFLDSCQDLPEIPPSASQGTSIVHGRQDESVDWRGSATYADADLTCDLHLVTGDHSLSEPRHEALITWCVRDRWARDVVGLGAIDGKDR